MSFALPLPSPGGKISTFVDTFKSTLAQGVADAAVAAMAAMDEIDCGDIGGGEIGGGGGVGDDELDVDGTAALRRHSSTRLQARLRFTSHGLCIGCSVHECLLEGLKG